MTGLLRFDSITFGLESFLFLRIRHEHKELLEELKKKLK